MAVRRFWDPKGERFGTPTYPWKLAPEGYATRRQLRARGLRPGGQEQLMWTRWGEVRVAYLYLEDLALPVRPMTGPKAAALAAAMKARRTCPQCGRDAGYVLPTRYGVCVSCIDVVEAA